MIAANTPVTPEQLIALPDSKGLEIVRGQIVEKRVGYESSELAIRLGIILGSYCLQHHLGRISGADGGFQCFPDDPAKMRKPDLAFVSYAKLPAMQQIGAYCKIPPDLAIEVLSPHDEAQEVGDKVKDYLAAGVPIVWVVDGFLRLVIVHSTGRPQVFSIGDELTVEPVLPGFRCPVSKIFEGIPIGG